MADAVEPLPPPPPECGGGVESPSPAASPEFEFWMVGKTFPSPALLTADELFSDGVVLPLHNVQASSPADGDGDGVEAPDSTEAEEEGPETEAQPLAESAISPTPDLPAVTFKWKDIFKGNNGGGGESSRKKTERRVSSVSGNAELININIWPFSRSRSAGHGAAASLSRAKPPSPGATTANGSGNGVVAGNSGSNGGGTTSAAASSSSSSSSAPAPAARKVSSAPCSRSNSRGDSGPEPAAAIPTATIPAAAVEAPVPGPTSMLRRLVPGHGRTTTAAGGASATTGIRLGRPSPVWQLRRNKLQQEQKQASSAKKKAAALSPAPGLAPSDDSKPATAAAAATTPSVGAPSANGCRNNAEGGGVEEGPNPPQGLFGLRTFFSKKVY